MRSYVIGDPIAHSLSPVLHRAAYKELGLDWTFDKVRVAPLDLEAFMKSLGEDTAGLAVTMPHKQAIIPLLDAVEPMAEAVGAVNTVVPAGRVLSGFNTDVYGIVEAIREVNEPATGGKAVILGARATASSALAALGQLHIGEVATVARSFAGPGSIGFAETRLGVSTSHIKWADQSRAEAALNAADVVISTVPTGVADWWAQRYQPKPGSVVLDVAYDPWPSKLAEAALRAGAYVVPGHLMLLHQACQQVELMTGHKAPNEAMRAALAEALQ